jgi:hypothetical protein
MMATVADWRNRFDRFLGLMKIRLVSTVKMLHTSSNAMIIVYCRTLMRIRLRQLPPGEFCGCMTVFEFTFSMVTFLPLLST